MASDLTTIFAALKRELRKYSKKLVSKTDDDSHFDLWSTKDVVIAGRRYQGVFFAGIAIQKSYVTLHYMPVYANPEMKKVFSPELLKLLKGKACFHVGKLDDELLAQIGKALAAGYELYRKNGWV